MCSHAQASIPLSVVLLVQVGLLEGTIYRSLTKLSTSSSFLMMIRMQSSLSSLHFYFGGQEYLISHFNPSTRALPSFPAFNAPPAPVRVRMRTHSRPLHRMDLEAQCQIRRQCSLCVSPAYTSHGNFVIRQKCRGVVGSTDYFPCSVILDFPLAHVITILVNDRASLLSVFSCFYCTAAPAVCLGPREEHEQEITLT